jgi:hypothetical protein
MKRHEVTDIVRRKYRRYANQVIEQIKSLPPECRQSGDDSPLKDVWEEFKYQLQEEHSILFDAYEDTIQGLCNKVVVSLPEEEQALLWLRSDAYFDSDEETIPKGQRLVNEITEELYREVSSIASDEGIE